MWDKTNETDLGRRVAALEAQTVDLQQRVAAFLEAVEVRYAPVDDHRDTERRVKPPQWRCPAVNCYHHYGAAWCRHGKDHEWRHDCAEFCCCNTCQPVPASPEVAIPDVPTPVGTDAFRREMTGHMQTLAQAYSWDADSLPMWGRDYLERLAERACTLRDAYDLARVGENEAAQEKLREIEW